jgi:hypothetical protein
MAGQCEVGQRGKCRAREAVADGRSGQNEQWVEEESGCNSKRYCADLWQVGTRVDRGAERRQDTEHRERKGMFNEQVGSRKVREQMTKE